MSAQLQQQPSLASPDEVPFDEAVEQLRRRFGVPKSIADRLINQESGGNDSATSPVGAHGRMQMMPSTFAGIAKASGKRLDINNPLDNVYAGLRYLSDNYNQFKGRAKNEKHAWAMALAAYHAGPDSVARDLDGGGLGIPDVGDGLTNTQDYVYNILSGVKPEDFAPQSLPLSDSERTQIERDKKAWADYNTRQVRDRGPANYSADSIPYKNYLPDEEAVQREPADDVISTEATTDRATGKPLSLTDSRRKQQVEAGTVQLPQQTFSPPPLPERQTFDLQTMEGRQARDARDVAERTAGAYLEVAVPVSDVSRADGSQLVRDAYKQAVIARGVPAEYFDEWQKAHNASGYRLRDGLGKEQSVADAMNPDSYDEQNKSLRIRIDANHLSKIVDDYKASKGTLTKLKDWATSDETSAGEKLLDVATPVAQGGLRTLDIATRPLQAVDAAFWAKLRGADDFRTVVTAYQQFFGDQPELGKSVIAELIRSGKMPVGPEDLAAMALKGRGFDRAADAMKWLGGGEIKTLDIGKVNPRLPALLAELANMILQPSNLIPLGAVAEGAKALKGGGRVAKAVEGLRDLATLDRGFVEPRPLGLSGVPTKAEALAKVGAEALPEAIPHHSNYQPRSEAGQFVEGKPEPPSADRLRLEERAARTLETQPQAQSAQATPIVESSVPTREQALAKAEPKGHKTAILVDGADREGNSFYHWETPAEQQISETFPTREEAIRNAPSASAHRDLAGKLIPELDVNRASVMASDIDLISARPSRSVEVHTPTGIKSRSGITLELSWNPAKFERLDVEDIAKSFPSVDPSEIEGIRKVRDSLLGAKYFKIDVGFKTEEAAQRAFADVGNIGDKTAMGQVLDAMKVPERDVTSTPKVLPESSVPTKAQSLSSQAGSADLDLLTLGVRKFVGEDVVPTAKKVTEGVSETADAVRSLVAPPSRGTEAKATSRIVRANAADMARTYDIAEQSLKGAKDFFSKQSPADNYAFIDRVEKGIAQPDPNQQSFADTLRTMLDERRQAVQDLGTGKLEDFIDNYFPHIWDDPAKAKAVFGKRPLEGSKSFLKQRSLPTTADGLAAGLKPVSDNPVDLTLLKIREMDRYVMAHQIMGEMKEQGILKYVRASEKLPDGYAFIDDRVATVYGGPDAKPQGGMLIRGRYAAPEPAARVLNNYLSPGIRGTKFAKPYEMWRSVGNTLNQAQLGLSFFHAMMTTVDAGVSRFAAGLEDLLVHGRPLKGAKTLASTTVSPITNLIQGNRVLAEWYKPNSVGGEIADIVNAMVEGGGRARMDEFYRVRAVERMNKAFDEATAAFRDGNIFGGISRTLKYNVAALQAIPETLTKPIMEWLVPRQKAGVFAELAKRELERLGPNADRMVVRDAMARAWDSVDNRMGQLVYDNLFWDKVTKDVAMSSVRSVGWNVGTLRELGGGVADVLTVPKRIKEGEAWLTHRMAYVVSLPAVVGVMGAVTQYLLTGEGPKELKDLYFPRTGNVDERGNPERIAYASYMKDVYPFVDRLVHGDVKGLPSVAGHMTASKLHPLITNMAEMFSNEDYYGTQIRNPDDLVVKQMLDSLKHLGTSIVPFSVQGFAKERERGTSLGKSLLPFVGITPAPAYVNKSEGVRMMDEMLGEKRPEGARTQEDASRSLAKYGFVRRMRKGEKFEALRPEIMGAVKDGTLNLRDLPDILRKSFGTDTEARFKQLTLEQALKVFPALSPEEKEQTIDELRRKRYLLLNIPEGRRKAVEAKFNELTRQSDAPLPPPP